MNQEHPQTLRPGNSVINAALRVAMGVVYRLNDAGAVVTGISIRGGTPVLALDRAPMFVSGAITVRRARGEVRESVRAARYFGAQIEWTEREARRAGGVL